MYVGGGEDSTFKNVLEFIIECTNNSQDPRRSRDRQYSTSPVRNLLCGLLLASLQLGTISTTSTSRPPDIIHIDMCSQAFPVFRRSSASVYYTERKPKNKTTLANYQLSAQCTYWVTCMKKFQVLMTTVTLFCVVYSSKMYTIIDI